MKGTSVVDCGYIPKEMQWETKFEKKLKEIAKTGLTYAEWQKQKYATKVSHKKGVVNEELL